MKLFMNIKVTDKIDLCRDVKRIAFSQILTFICYAWKNINLRNNMERRT